MLVSNVIPALIVLTAVVFVHEMGHFLVARWCGIRVAAFSIGFGRELAGFNDRNGTRWKVSAIPLGGYVRFEGDDNAASIPDAESFGARSTPANASASSISLRCGSALRWSRPVRLPTSFWPSSFSPRSSPSLAASMSFRLSAVSMQVVRPTRQASWRDDRIVSINGDAIVTFSDIQDIVIFAAGEDLKIEVDRNGELVSLTAVPEVSATLPDRRWPPH